MPNKSNSKWHAYPDELPENFGVYLVTLFESIVSIAQFIPATGFTSHSWRSIINGEEISKDYIKAWQEMPEPYLD